MSKPHSTAPSWLCCISEEKRERIQGNFKAEDEALIQARQKLNCNVTFHETIISIFHIDLGEIVHLVQNAETDDAFGGRYGKIEYK